MLSRAVNGGGGMPGGIIPIPGGGGPGGIGGGPPICMPGGIGGIDIPPAPPNPPPAPPPPPPNPKPANRWFAIVISCGPAVTSDATCWYAAAAAVASGNRMPRAPIRSGPATKMLARERRVRGSGYSWYACLAYCSAETKSLDSKAVPECRSSVRAASRALRSAPPPPTMPIAAAPPPP